MRQLVCRCPSLLVKDYLGYQLDTWLDISRVHNYTIKLMSLDAVKVLVNNCCKMVKVATARDSTKIVKVDELP